MVARKDDDESCQMEYYLPLKQLHMFCAYLSAGLFMLRLLLDMAGKPGWRLSPVRYLPHINDTLLLTLAFTLLAIGPWQPFVHQWLGFKILLLLGYIVFGIGALKQRLSLPVRAVCAVIALAHLAGIFYLARFKPLLFV
ncbi:MAG: SirB2 family protein [Pseudomonadota bacterium]|uniref:Invasion gene expression up-regulator, SirB n=1 Tax=Rheinheimera nanhaiensis E407-8 TaxID=562729 RepID=I1DV75_9GAMM|nr:SirB2 family protein [Rheinheimera nanhaiensis]GAB57953.1 invasion gene expression up-regulator, SirB [Rheinheimera nanhaiensis E407-8]